MKVSFLLIGLLVASAAAPVAIAEQEQPMVVYATDTTPVRIRTSQIRSWTSEDDLKLVLTTNQREQFLVEFERPCFNLSRGPDANALVTDSSWLDRNDAVRIMHRDHLPLGGLADHNGGDVRMTVNANSSYCAIRNITALGKKASIVSDKS